MEFASGFENPDGFLTAIRLDQNFRDSEPTLESLRHNAAGLLEECERRVPLPAQPQSHRFRDESVSDEPSEPSALRVELDQSSGSHQSKLGLVLRKAGRNSALERVSVRRPRLILESLGVDAGETRQTAKGCFGLTPSDLGACVAMPGATVSLVQLQRDREMTACLAPIAALESEFSEFSVCRRRSVRTSRKDGRNESDQNKTQDSAME